LQNELIVVCRKMIQADIVKRVNESVGYSVLADETSDIRNTEQLSICVRYVSDRALREGFLRFVPVSDLTGQGLATTILETLENHGLDLSKLIGQGYDGAAAMSGCLRGTQASIRQQYPRAIYVRCGAHRQSLQPAPFQS
jgi:hypothetical protein